MKTLYLSDLDGTLLRPDERISKYTINTINRFVRGGGYFSYATGRSLVTASKVTAGLDTEFPVICYNGGFIMASKTRNILSANYFTPAEIRFASETLGKYEVFPIVYAFINGTERFSYVAHRVTPAINQFLENRIGDPRCREVNSIDALYTGDVFYFSCMGTDLCLNRINEAFSADSRYNCIYHRDIYTKTQWCEILPARASKANAASQLKAILGCEKLIAFGDGINDISMFSIADECYAVSNAAPELKEIATAVIGSNSDDGVAKWIEEYAI